jgi:hypothetical protein
MEPFEPLSELFEPDLRNDIWPDVSLADRHAEMVELDLDGSVPEVVRSSFNIARMLYVYGWLYWPFYTLSVHQVLRTLEMALIVRIAREDSVPDTRHWHAPSLTTMLKRAMKERWVVDAGLSYAVKLRERHKEYLAALTEAGDTADIPEDSWLASDRGYTAILVDALPHLRNEFAHPKHYWHGMPETSEFRNVRDLIHQLFQNQGSDGVVEAEQ